ncbi:MAG TPA: transporter substrate-binding domain-containing protein [Saprospiraceae bacterium]|nr:transporter substrate-binding domain-containing protein [Saprospiraceae bacterium]
MKRRIITFWVLVFSLFFTTFSWSKDTLLVGYTPSSIFIKKQGNELRGPSAWLWERVCDDLDLSYQAVEMPLDTLLAALTSGALDAGISPLTITSSRQESMDFSPPFYIAYSSVMVRAASPLKRSLRFVASFFSINFFRALGALVFVILIFGALEWWFERKHNTAEFEPGLKGLWQGFWWSAVTMTTVGYGDKSPQTVGGRIIALVWMFTAIIIISGFTASIASSLTVNQLGSNQSQIQDFKQKPLATVSNSATEQWLLNHFFTNLKEYKDIPAMVEAMEAGEVEGIAYDQPILQSLAESDSLSRFETLPLTYNPQFYALGFDARLPDTLKRDISVKLLEEVESQDWKVLLTEYNLSPNP